MKATTSSRQIAEKYLQNILHSTAVGNRLPPIRQMINESGTSRKVLEIFLKRFEEQQLIERRQRIGIIRTAGYGKRIWNFFRLRYWDWKQSSPVLNNSVSILDLEIWSLPKAESRCRAAI